MLDLSNFHLHLDWTCKNRSRLAMFARLFRKAPKHSRLPQSDTENLDNETLLPSSLSTSLSPLKAIPLHSRAEYRVALKSFILCTVVYLSVGVWIAFSVRRAVFVTDADEFCIGHVSQYCKVL